MPSFDPTTTSGNALAELFRTWCDMRGDDPEGAVSGGDLAEAVRDMFVALGLDVGGPASQVDPADHRTAFTVFGLTYDHADALLVSAVLPGEHADNVIELSTDEPDHGRWAACFVAPSADAAATLARRQVESGEAEDDAN